MKAAADTSGKILVVDDHTTARQSVIDALSVVGYEVHGCDSAKAALHWLEHHRVDLIVTDLMMPGMDGLEFLKRLRNAEHPAQTVMMTAHATVGTAVEAMRYGAYDYLEKPFDVQQLEDIVAGALQRAASGGSRSEIVDASQSELLIGESPVMQRLKQQLQQIAQADVTVLITGESGTGKELVARSLHQMSPRAASPLVSLNCPALSPQLMESELFGHERGAFTNAHQPRIGRFELADQGTIFLDEVTELEIGLQAKLLRVLQERTFERVGSNKTQQVDVRVVAATNRSLQDEVAAGRFREDLYFRLAVVPIEVPPLRDRGDDVLRLASHFLQQSVERLGRPSLSLSDACQDALLRYSWPGNVRELQNRVMRATVLATGEVLQVADLGLETSAAVGSPPEEPHPLARPRPISDSVLEQHQNGPGNAAQMGTPAASVAWAPGMRLDEVERQVIEATLARFDGHREQTAKALGIGVRTLANKLKSYGYAPRERSFQNKPSQLKPGRAA